MDISEDMAEEECFRITRQLEKDRQKAAPSGTLRAIALRLIQTLCSFGVPDDEDPFNTQEFDMDINLHSSFGCFLIC